MMEFLDLNARGVAGDVMSPEGEGKRYFFQNSFRFAALVQETAHFRTRALFAVLKHELG